MGRKKIDSHIEKIVHSCKESFHRSLFFIYGTKSKDQVVYLHHLLLKNNFNENPKKLSVLWCFKRDLGFHTYDSKRVKKLKKKYAHNYSLSKEDVLEHFLLSCDIHPCHFSETDKVLGQTFSMLVIQDFEGITPNHLARLVECVEGGGIIVILLSQITDMQEICTLKMDAHSKYATESYPGVIPQFNRRFLFSLSSCKNVIIMDDDLKIKMINNVISEVKDTKLKTNKHKSRNGIVQEDDSSFSVLFQQCCTLDQATCLRKILNILQAHEESSILSLTSGRGRGKSAILGLGISLAIHHGFSNVYVTAPHVENVQTLFSFVVKGLATLNLKENEDFKLYHNDETCKSFITGITIYRSNHKSVTYIRPIDSHKIGNADLVVIDEAAAIPLPLVKQWIKFRKVFLASTISGYEGTGRSLSLKLLNQLRSESIEKQQGHQNSKDGHTLHEVQLHEAIRYAQGDPVEEWLNRVLCLDASIELHMDCSLPESKECQLYLVDREVLFSYSPLAESFLQQMVSLYVSSHYKNSPNDLMMMADAPAHQLFCLLSPTDEKSVPTILCVIQIAFEGGLSKKTWYADQSQGKRASGDLIPWIISQQFQDSSFPSLLSARVVRIATHPACQRQGYGRLALNLLSNFFAPASKSKSQTNLTNVVSPLLRKPEETSLPSLDYIGVSFGLVPELFKFWKTSGFVPLYIRQTTSEVTGEHSCIMIKSLKQSTNELVTDFYADFRERLLALLPTAFTNLPSTLVLSILQCSNELLQERLKGIELEHLESSVSEWLISLRSLQRLEAYCSDQVDYHLILDLLPMVCRFYFLTKNDGTLTSVMENAMISLGLQNKDAAKAAEELNMESHQVLGCFKKALRKILNKLKVPVNQKHQKRKYDEFR